MVVEDALVHEGLVASDAVELACCLVVFNVIFGTLGLSIDAAYGGLPSEQTALLPLALEHLHNLVVYFQLEVD
jgi:hypothetical protein